MDQNPWAVHPAVQAVEAEAAQRTQVAPTETQPTPGREQAALQAAVELAAQAAHTLLDRKYPEAQVTATLETEQVWLLAHWTHWAPAPRYHPERQVVAIWREEQVAAPEAHLAQLALAPKNPWERHWELQAWEEL